VLEFLRNDTLPKRILADRALLEELLQEAEFYCIEKLVTEIKSKLDSAQHKKIHLHELQDHLDRGFHVVGIVGEHFHYHRCPHGHDEIRTNENFFYDSPCRHSHVELVEACDHFVIVSTNIPVGPIFDATHRKEMGNKNVVKIFK